MRSIFIGDVQGCCHELQLLLKRLSYQPNNDHLIFLGDLINRGPHSLATLEFIRTLDHVTVTLGNHDLYFLAMGYGAIEPRGQHTLDDLLHSQHLSSHLDWLRQQKILYCDESLKMLAMHAGIPPQWTVAQAKKYANELEQHLRGPDFFDYFQHMLGNTPATWNAALTSWDRLRYITNAFTRLRFCTADGQLELTEKSSRHCTRAEYHAWFEWPRDWCNYQVCFGHWAALEGQCQTQHIHALDTGCVWGNALSALAVDTDGRQTLFQVPALKKY
jgi:bis(5'-nucleosyl)-tetraphosphatase (symmetrical)